MATRFARVRNYVNQDAMVNVGRPKVQLLLRLFRLAQYTRRPYDGRRTFAARLIGILYVLVSDWLMGVDIPARTSIGPRLRIQHTAGIVINPRAILGSDVTLLHGVTIGVLDGKRKGTPTIHDRVEICAHAVVVGEIDIGRGAFIGANAVVMYDVPDLGVVAGNPAQLRRYRAEPGY